MIYHQYHIDDAGFTRYWISAPCGLPTQWWSPMPGFAQVNEEGATGSFFKSWPAGDRRAPGPGVIHGL